jgi:hypothetical protein
VRCAAAFGVTTVNVADLLAELERHAHIDNATPYATRILETGYYSKELRYLSWRRTVTGSS